MWPAGQRPCALSPAVQDVLTRYDVHPKTRAALEHRGIFLPQQRLNALMSMPNWSLNRPNLETFYTPGVGHRAKLLEADPSLGRRLLVPTVGIVGDGSATLGFGGMPPESARAILEVKAALLAGLGFVNAVAMPLDRRDFRSMEEMAQHIYRNRHAFDALMLEDVAAPGCFELENKLREWFKCPVMHDDQHGTAYVARALLINAAHCLDINLADRKVVLSGVGAAGTAILGMLMSLGIPLENIYPFDWDPQQRAVRFVHPDWKEHHIFDIHSRLCDSYETADRRKPTLTRAEAMHDASLFLGVSAGNLPGLADEIAFMSDDALVMALANPHPEITPDQVRAKKPRAVVVTGSPNFGVPYNNNVNGFPFMFSAALLAGAQKITRRMRAAGSAALAHIARQDIPVELLPFYQRDVVRAFGRERLLIEPWDPRMAYVTATMVQEAIHDEEAFTAVKAEDFDHEALVAGLLESHAMMNSAIAVFDRPSSGPVGGP